MKKDPPTAQFIEVLIFAGVLLAIHLIAFIVARSSMGLISQGYLVFCCLVLPIASIAGCVLLRSVRGWRWGQVALTTLLGLLLSFIQFLIVAAASAAV
jgi:hypothetical protein